MIVGQGLAGSLLATFLMKKGKKIIVIDSFSPSSSSQIAAGLVHPITGRRIVKTWLADTAFPFAFAVYKDLEKEYGRSFFQKMNILEILSNAKQWNDWTGRKSDPEIAALIDEAVDETIYTDCLQPFHHLVPVKNSGWLNIPAFLFSIRSRLKETAQLVEESFEYESMKIHSDGISYNAIHATRIIFCEGYKIADNPYWSWVPMLPAKGEILTIEVPGLPEESILMKSIFIVPLGSNLFRVGATYSWSPLDEIITEGALYKLQEQLEEILKIPYTVISQKAGVRPTVKDRRPLIGEHPKFRNVFLFNGLGTKGVSLGPWFAAQFADHLEEGKDLDPEADVRRFHHLSSS